MLEISEVESKFVLPLIIVLLTLGVTTSNWWLPLYISLAKIFCFQIAYVFAYLRVVKKKLKPSLKGYVDESRGDVVSICFVSPFMAYCWYFTGIALSYLWHVYS